MTVWFKRELTKRIIGPLAWGVVSVLVCLFYIWIFGSSFGDNNSSGRKKVYKNYVEKTFTSEMVIDQDTFERRAYEDSLLVNQEHKKGTFVVIPIEGPILGENAQRIADQLFIATKITKNMKAIIFLVDSPGGGVTESDNLFEDIRRIRTRGIKTIAFVDGLAASGAYYMTAQSDKIIASPTAVVGSVGVIWESINIEKLSQKIGLSVDVVKSSTMKDIGSPFKKMSEDERVVLRKIVDYDYGRFKSIVQKGRKLNNWLIDIVATGEVWHSEDAKKLGLIDRIGYVDKAIDAAKELTGVSDYKVVKYEEEITLWDILGTNSPVASLARNLDNSFANPIIPAPKLLYMWIP